MPGLKLFPKFLCLSREDSEEEEDKEEGDKEEGDKDEEKGRDPKNTSKRRKVEKLPSANDLLATVMAAYPFNKDLNQVSLFF